jgi:hypothetical protein
MSDEMTAPPDGIRVGVMSDLHLEFEPDYWERWERLARRGDSSAAAEALRRRAELREEPDHPMEGPDLRGLKSGGVDLMLLPGDIHVGARSVRYADSVARYLGCPVYLCLGNHEGYKGDMQSLPGVFKQTAASTDGRVTVLEMDRANLEIRGRRITILGAVCWTDYRVNGNDVLGMMQAGRALNDHSLIRYGERAFTPGDALEIHRATRAWLAREVPLAREDADIVIVMTHHAPIPDGNPPQYRGGDLAPAFVSDMRQEIMDWQPDLWVWGHTHHSMQTELGSTRLVSAQRGYVGIETGADLFLPLVLDVAPVPRAPSAPRMT